MGRRDHDQAVNSRLESWLLSIWSSRTLVAVFGSSLVLAESPRFARMPVQIFVLNWLSDLSKKKS